MVVSTNHHHIIFTGCVDCTGRGFCRCTIYLYAILKREIHKIINDSPDPQSACQKIVDTANERGGSDNISLIILSAGGPDTKENESDDSPTVINS